MKRYTVDDVLELNPCSPYTRREIQKLWGKRKSLSLVSIMKLGIPVEDRMWVACRLLDRRTLVAWACDCVERVLPIFEKEYPKDKRPRKVIETTRKRLRGKATPKDVEDAATAAHRSSIAARTAAAIYVAYAAINTTSACRNSVLRAGAQAAEAITCATNACAAYATERAWQSNRLLEYVRGEVTP